MCIYKLDSLLFFNEIVRYDPIAFESDFSGESLIYIKRLIAKENDVISIEVEGLKINNLVIPHDPVIESFTEYIQEVDSTFIKANDYIFYLLDNSLNSMSLKKTFRKRSNSIVVPNGYFFVIGDNYNQSMDSRFFGFIHKNQIIGKVIFVF